MSWGRATSCGQRVLCNIMAPGLKIEPWLPETLNGFPRGKLVAIRYKNPSSRYHVLVLLETDSVLRVELRAGSFLSGQVDLATENLTIHDNTQCVHMHACTLAS